MAYLERSKIGYKGIPLLVVKTVSKTHCSIKIQQYNKTIFFFCVLARDTVSKLCLTVEYK